MRRMGIIVDGYSRAADDPKSLEKKRPTRMAE
jgi:hypothetical protein